MPKKKAKSKTAGDPTAGESFEESLSQLERIVEELEGGELGLADALDRYEQGVSRLRSCHAQLEAAERRIELLSGVDADGNPITEPFDDTATAPRSQKRSIKQPPGGSSEGEAGVDDASRLL